MLGDELPFTNNDIILPKDSTLNVKKIVDIKKDGFLILNLNINSILSRDGVKLIELNELVKESKPEVIAITETWLTETNCNEEIELKGYQIIRRDRVDKRGGGVMLYIKAGYNYKELNVSNPALDNPLETLWVEIANFGGKSTIVGACYRPPTARGFVEALVEEIDLASDQGKPMILMGDMNIDLSKENKATTDYKTAIENYGFTQIIKYPTRVRNGTVSTLDHIWLCGINCLDSGTIVGFSDHLCTFANIKGDKIKKQDKAKRWCRDYKRYSGGIFAKTLKRKGIHSVVTEDSNIEQDVGNFENIFTEALDEVAPYKWQKGKAQQKRPWVTSELKNIFEEKRRAELRAIHTGTDRDWDEFYLLRNRSSNLNKKLKTEFYNNKVEKAKRDNKEIWKIAKNIFPNFKKKNSNMFEKLSEKEEIDTSNKFNHHYLNFVKNLGLQEEVVEDINCQDNENSLRIKEVGNGEIEKIIMAMDSSKACGIDNIKVKHLKEVITLVSPVISKIVNKSIRYNIFPSRYKESLVVPIIKDPKKSRLDPGNNRPVSLLPVIGKIIERVIQNQLVEYLKSNNLMSNEQHGFRKNHSTVTCLLEMTEDIRDNFDKGKISGIVAIDLSKAFDTIRHKVLLKKLKTLNLANDTITWFKSYLSGRQQRVKINETKSQPGTVEYGVPQGSILGPLLFSLYINDLSQHVGNCKAKIYADDTTIYTGSESESILKENLEEALSGVMQYFSKVGLKMNAEKCQFIIIGNKKRIEEITLNINGHILNQSENIKILGIIFDRKLKWDGHIQNITKKCRSLMGILFKGKHLVNENTKKTAF